MLTPRSRLARHLQAAGSEAGRLAECLLEALFRSRLAEGPAFQSAMVACRSRTSLARIYHRPHRRRLLPRYQSPEPSCLSPPVSLPCWHAFANLEASLQPRSGFSFFEGSHSKIVWVKELVAKPRSGRKNAAQGAAPGNGAGAASPEEAKEACKRPFAPLVLVPKCGSAHAVRC